MSQLLKFLFYLCLLSTIIGPLGLLPFAAAGVNVYLTDILVGIISIVWFGRIPQLVKMIRKDKVVLYFWAFVVLSFLSLIFSPILLSFTERVISGLYLVRLFAYFFVYVTGCYLIKTKVTTSYDILKGLVLVGLILAFIGWVQYFLYPDLRNLYYLGWDPHYKRIFGSFFDPNYFGLMMVLTFILLLLAFQPQGATWLFSFFIFVTLVFTYSRSSFLSLIAATLFYSLTKRKLLLVGVVMAALGFSIFLLPRPYGEGVRLERVVSIEQRIENWQQAVNIFTKHPLFGVGFNAIRYAKKQYGLKDVDWLISHAGAGFDNSFLFVGATTGIIGLTLYLLLLRQVFISGQLLTKVSLMAVITHSLFLNSLFFPWIMFWLWTILALDRR